MCINVASLHNNAKLKTKNNCKFKERLNNEIQFVQIINKDTLIK